MGIIKKSVAKSDKFKEGIRSEDDIKDPELGRDSHHYARLGGIEFFSPAKVRDSDWLSVFIYVFIYLFIGLAILVSFDIFFNGFSFKDFF